MIIEVLFNSASDKDDWAVGWGLSFLIDRRILFDTGEKGPALLHNMDKLKVDIPRIEAVVISHDHWDHAGGLEEILKRKRGANVFTCPGFSDILKKKIDKAEGVLCENDGFCEIAENIYVTGEIQGDYKGKSMPEQALILKTDKGINVITGCAHPGIGHVLGKVQSEFPGQPFHVVGGGFHLMDKTSRQVETIVDVFKKFGVQKTGPTHCSGSEAEKFFLERYGKNYLSLKVGESFEV